MSKLYHWERSILKTITEIYPFRYEEIKKIYLKTKSFDAIIKTCDYTMAQKIDIKDVRELVVDIVNNYDE